MSPAAPTVERATGDGAPASPDRSRRVVLAVLVTAVVVLVGSVIAAPWIVHRLPGGDVGGVGVGVGDVGGGSPGMMGGRAGMTGGRAGMMGGRAGMMGGRAGMMGGSAGMMAGQVWLAGDGRAVTSIDQARSRAARASSSAGLHPGEIVRFRQNVYVELKDAAGVSVTEVLVDPSTGAVTTEPGPAMMWNTGSRAASVPVERARAIAAGWLQAHRSGETVGSIDAYPGYYTVDTQDGGGTMVGMLSVNATTGAVWYHTWHGTFVAKEDA